MSVVSLNRIAALAAVLAAALFAIHELVSVLQASRGGFLAFNDFFAQWSFARFAQGSATASIYDADALHRFQVGLEPQLRQSFPFPYPPTYLLVIWPLAAMPFGTAQIVWDLVTLVMFVVAIGWRRPLWVVPAALLAPAVVMCLAYGQNGLLLGALIVGGMRLLRRRPALAGILLGLATIKPALGLLIPVALIASREWRATGSAAITALALAGLAAWAFGPQAWLAWIDVITNHAGWVAAAVSDYRKPALLATLSLFGLDPALAQAIQIAVSIVVVVLVWIASRPRSSSPVVLAGTFVAMPFAFVYDLPMTVEAVVCLLKERPARVPELVILALGYLFPALTTLTTRFFVVNPLALGLLFGLAVLRAMQTKTPQLDEPGRS